MASPDWKELSEKYLLDYIDNNVRNYNEYFGKDAKTNIHNAAFNMLNQNNYIKKRHTNVRRQGMVKHADKMLPYLQKKLIDEHKIIKYQVNGKEVIRSNVEWTPNEVKDLTDLRKQGFSYRNIARRLKRSRLSVIDKAKNLKLE